MEEVDGGPLFSWPFDGRHYFNGSGSAETGVLGPLWPDSSLPT